MSARSRLGILFTVVAIACGGGSSGGNTPPAAGRWTVLVYMMADNNLEPFAIDNLNQMASVGSGNGLNLAVQVDRSGRYTNAPIGSIAASRSVKRLLVQRGGFQVAQELGDVDMSDPATLADFIRWGVKTYPADRYAVVFWDHGGDWLGGFGQDESHGGAALSLAALAQGIRSGRQQAGIAKLSLIGFDACLMGAFEVAESLKGEADYLLASEEVEPGAGWDYGSLAALQQASASDPVTASRAIIDGYRAQNRSDPTVTLSLVDLNQLSGLEAALSTLDAQLTSQIAVQAAAVGKGRQEALEFGRQPDPTSSFHQVDLGDLASRLAAANGAFAPIQQAIQAALAQAVVYSVSGAAAQGASGISIYFPPSLEMYQVGGGRVQQLYRSLPGVEHWRTFLEAYLGAPVAKPTFTTHVASRTPVQGGSAISAPLSAGAAASIATATLTYGYAFPATATLSDVVALYGDQPASFDAATVTATWDQTVFQLVQGTNKDYAYLSIQDQGNGLGLAIVPLAYLPPGVDDCSATTQVVTRQLVFDQAGSVQSDRYFAYQNSTAGELRTEPGSGLRPLFLAVVGTQGLTQAPSPQDQQLSGWTCTGGPRFDASPDPRTGAPALDFAFATPQSTELPPGTQLLAELDVANPAGDSDFAFALWSP